MLHTTRVTAEAERIEGLLTASGDFTCAVDLTGTTHKIEATVGRCQGPMLFDFGRKLLRNFFPGQVQTNEAGDDCRTITIACMPLPQIATTGCVASIGLFTRLE